jgi:hypothetical protein
VTDRLERTYSLALRLDAIGADDALIAECVGVEPEAVRSMVEIASRKAADIARAGDDAVAKNR